MTMIVYPLLGAAAGYGWYRLVGCRSGTCPITSNPWVSTAYGLLMGVVLGQGWSIH